MSILLNKIEDNLKECLSTMKKPRLTMLLPSETLMALIILVLFRKMYLSTIHSPDKLSLSGFVKTNLILQAEVKMKSNKTWFIGSSCSEHMTGEMTDFISLQKQNGGKISFGEVQQRRGIWVLVSSCMHTTDPHASSIRSGTQVTKG